MVIPLLWNSFVTILKVAILLSIIVNIEWEISRLAVSVNFFNDVTVPVVFHFDGWSMKAVIVFVVVGDMVRASSVMTGCGLVVLSLEAVLTCIVKWGNCMSPCVVSRTTLLFLIKCNTIIGPVNFFITTNCSANELSPISNLSVAVDNGFSNWPLATCIWKLGGSSTLRMLLGAFCLIVSKSSWAIALTNALESTRASTVRFFSKSGGTYSTSCFRFRTTVDVNGRFISFVCSSHTNPSSISGVAVVSGGVVVSPFGVVTTCCFVFWVLVEEFLEQSRNDTGSFPVWFPEDCSVATTWFCGWVPLGGDVWLAIFVFKVESLVVLFKLSWSVMISVGCCQTTSGIGGSLHISFVSGLSRAAPEWRRGVFSLKLGLQLGHCCLSCFELYSVNCGSVLPVVYFVEVGRRSVCCLCSNVAFLRGMVSSATCLTGWEYRSRFSVSLIIYIVSFGFVCNFVVGVRVCLGVSIVVVGTICIISRLVFLSFELTALILIVTWFFTMVARWLGLVRVLLRGLLRYSVYGHFIWSFQTIQF